MLRCFAQYWVALEIGLIAFPWLISGAEFRGGHIYAIGSDRKKLLFTIHADLQVLSARDRIFVSEYLDSDQLEVMTETAAYRDLKLQKYRIVQKQLNESYELKVEGNKLHFLTRRNGKTETQDRELPEDLIIGPSLVPFFGRHWNDLKHQKVKAQVAVLEREDTYGFEFEKLEEVSFESKKAVVIKMSPTSSFVSAFVQPTYFTVSEDGTRILRVIGRMLPKVRKGTRWVDFEGEAIFTP